MKRATKVQLEGLVFQINQNLDVPHKRRFVLDTNSHYGGYRLSRIVNDDGGERDEDFEFYYRKTVREMKFFLQGILKGIQYANSLEMRAYKHDSSK